MAPIAEVAKPVIDLGKVPRGEQQTATFVLENKGLAELEILSARSSCSCAVAEYPETIAPGKSAELVVAVDTLPLSGPYSANVRVETNDLENPQIRLTVKVESTDTVIAHPGVFRYVVYQNFEGVGTIGQTMMAADEQPFKILRIESPYEFLTLSEPREATGDERLAKNNGSQWWFEATLDNSPPVGALVGNVVVHTDHPLQKRVPLPISGFVRPLVAMTPAIADFQTFELPENGTYVEVHVKQFAEAPMTIERVDSTVPGISVQPRVMEDGREWTFRVIAQPELAEGPFSGTISVYTSSEQQPKFELPVKGNRTAGSQGG